MRELGHLPKDGGVYISRWHHGSPAHRCLRLQPPVCLQGTRCTRVPSCQADELSTCCLSECSNWATNVRPLEPALAECDDCLASPCRFSLFGLNFITELDGVPTPDMDAFIAVASRLSDKTFVRVRLEELHSARSKVRSGLEGPSRLAGVSSCCFSALHYGCLCLCCSTQYSRVGRALHSI